MYMASPLIRLAKYVGRILSGMIITAKNETSEVKSSEYRKMTSPARSRFLSFGDSISRLTCARDSSPDIASTECPNPTRTMMTVRWENHVPFNHPKVALLRVMWAGMGEGGRWKLMRLRVNRHHPIRMTTITVVIFMMVRAFSLDSRMPWMFCDQKYNVTTM